MRGLSLAGGPTGTARLDNISLTRKNFETNKYEEYSFDFEKGGESDIHNFKLRPGDTIFIEKNEFINNRAYYTSLVSVVATILSSILVYREVKK